MSDRMKKGKEKEKEAYDLLHPGFFARMTGGGGNGDQMLAVSAYKNAAIEYKAANAADDALRCLNKACEMTERAGNLSECIQIRVQMATIYLTMKKDFEKSAQMYLKNAETYLAHGKNDQAVKSNMKASDVFNKNGDDERAFKIIMDTCTLLEKEGVKFMNPSEIYTIAIRTCLNGKPRRLDTALDLVRRLQVLLKNLGKDLAKRMIWRLYLSESVLLCSKDSDGIAAKLAMEKHMKQTEYLMSKEYGTEKEIVESILEEDQERLDKELHSRGGGLNSLDNSVARIAMKLTVKTTILKEEDKPVADEKEEEDAPPALPKVETLKIDDSKVEDTNSTAKDKGEVVSSGAGVLDAATDAPYISDSSDDEIGEVVLNI